MDYFMIIGEKDFQNRVSCAGKKLAPLIEPCNSVTKIFLERRFELIEAMIALELKRRLPGDIFIEFTKFFPDIYIALLCKDFFKEDMSLEKLLPADCTFPPIIKYKRIDLLQMSLSIPLKEKGCAVFPQLLAELKSGNIILLDQKKCFDVLYKKFGKVFYCICFLCCSFFFLSFDNKAGTGARHSHYCRPFGLLFFFFCASS